MQFGNRPVKPPPGNRPRKPPPSGWEAAVVHLPIIWFTLGVLTGIVLMLVIQSAGGG